MICLTQHARQRLQERHPDYSEQELKEMTEFAIRCGKHISAGNGCRQYQLFRKRFVVAENKGNIIVVTVI